MRQWRVALGTALMALLAACSYQAALDKLVSPERQAELVAMGKRMCSDPVGLSPQLHPDIANSLKAVAPLVPDKCPPDGAIWQLASYAWKTNVANGLTQRQEEFVIVATDPGTPEEAQSGDAEWTTVSMRLYAENGAPMQIAKWTLERRDEKPDALVYMENFEAGATAAAAVAVGILLLVVGLVIWLVVRHRRKRGVPDRPTSIESSPRA